MIARGAALIVFAPMFIGMLISALGILMPTTSYTIYLIGNLVILVSILFMVFFRDPERRIGKGVVAPADGKVMDVDRALGKVSIFMRIRDVHVNRAPAGGLVIDVERFRGAHVPAFRKDSERNERVVTQLKTSIGAVKIVQIAGIIARRIVPYIEPGDKLKKGQRIGLVRFGSRVDLYLPETVKIITDVGDRVYAGTTQIGALRDEMD